MFSKQLHGGNVGIENRREVRIKRSKLLNNPHNRALSYKLAETKEELEQAHHLVWESYVKVGLHDPDSPPMRVTRYHLLPETRVFIAVYKPELMKDNPDPALINKDTRIVGTITLAPNSEMGLSTETVCPDGMMKMYADGCVVAEVIALAIDPEFRRSNIMMDLYKIMFEYTVCSDITDLICAVTTKHRRFYQNLLLFEPIGAPIEDPLANGLKVQCHRLDLEKSLEKARKIYDNNDFDANLYDYFFKSECRRNPDVGNELSCSLFEHFLPYVQDISKEDLDYLEERYYT